INYTTHYSTNIYTFSLPEALTIFKSYELKALRDKVAMVLQKNVLFSGTVEENLKWGNENATHEEVVAAAKVAHADGFIREMPDGYNTMIEQGGNNVSGGQKQRLTIACTFEESGNFNSR